MENEGSPPQTRKRYQPPSDSESDDERLENPPVYMRDQSPDQDTRPTEDIPRDSEGIDNFGSPEQTNKSDKKKKKKKKNKRRSEERKDSDYEADFMDMPPPEDPLPAQEEQEEEKIVEQESEEEHKEPPVEEEKIYESENEDKLQIKEAVSESDDEVQKVSNEGLIRINVILHEALKKIGMDGTIEIPEIVVLGSQTSGKSSTIEMLLGINCLPTDVNICTRCPLNLRVFNTKEREAFFYLGDDRENKVFDTAVVKKYILDTTAKNCEEDGSDISFKEIDIEYYSDKATDLRLVDLPGLITESMDDQHQDLPKQIEELVQKYVLKEKSIILLVIPATQDIATLPTWNFIKNKKIDLNRVMGVLTKIDEMSRGTDCTEILNNKMKKLGHGYFGIKARSKEENMQDMSIDKAKEKEKAFFKSNPIYRGYESLLGSDTLALTLNNVLSKQMMECLPHIEATILEKIRDLDHAIALLGDHNDHSESAQKAAAFLVAKFSEIINHLTSALKNGEITTLGKKMLGGALIKETIDTMNEEVIDKLDPLKGMKTKQVEKEFRACCGINSKFIFEHSYATTFLKNKMKLFKEPFETTSEKCKVEIDRCAREIFREHLKTHKEFHKMISRIWEVISKRCKSKCSRELEEQMVIQTNFINFDNNYFKKFRKLIEGKGNNEKLTRRFEFCFGINPEYFSEHYLELENEQDQNEKGLGEDDRVQLRLLAKTVHCYFTILKNKFREDLFSFVIKYMVDDSLKQLNDAFITEIAMKQEELQNLAKEDGVIAERRNALKTDRDALNKVLNEIYCLRNNSSTD